MSTRAPQFLTNAALFVSCALSLFCGGVATASPATNATNANDSLEQAFRAAYPIVVAPSGRTYAGIDVARIAIAGLRVHARDERPVDRGGIVTSFADGNGVVRAIVAVAVARDEALARAFVDTTLRGVSSTLAPLSPSGGEFGYADDAGKGTHFVVGARGNVGYAITMLDATNTIQPVPTAGAVAERVRASIVDGPLSFPSGSIFLPAEFDRNAGVPVRISTAAGVRTRVHADGAYVAEARGTTLVRAYAPGPVTVHATLIDALGRVAVVQATGIAR